MKFLWSFLLTVILAASCPALGQTNAPQNAATNKPTITPLEAQQALAVLQDDGKRQQLIQTLKTISKASPAPANGAGAHPASPGIPRQVLSRVSDWADQLMDQFGSVARTVTDFPLLLPWVERLANDPPTRMRMVNLAWKLAVILACGVAVEFLLAWALGPLYRGIERHSPPNGAEAPLEADAEIHSRAYRFSATWNALRRLPFAIVGFLVAILPVAAYGLVANLLSATNLVGSTGMARLVILAVVNAYVVFKAIMCFTRLLVSHEHPRLAVFAINRENAAYIEVWVRRLAILILFGMALVNGAELMGLATQAGMALVKLVVLVVQLCLVIIVLQCRSSVSLYIRGSRNDRGVLAMARNRVADLWHYFAIVILLGLWVVWAIQIEDGVGQLLRVVGLTILVLTLGRLLLIVVLGTLDRIFHLNPTMVARYPGFERRANRYYPVLRGAIETAIWLATFVALLEGWGVDALGWFGHGRFGDRLLSALITVSIALVVAIAIWESANAAMERHLDRLTRAEQVTRAIRVKSLLPILRNILLIAILVVLGLTVLNQIGVNVGPLLAGAGILGVAIGFGSQKLVQDLITGLFLLLENAMQVGDWVTAGGLSGSVENLSIRTVRLRAGDGSLHIIPFSAVTAVTNTNRGVGNAAVSVNVALKEDPDRVGEVLQAIAVEMRADAVFGPVMLSDLQLWGVDKVDASVMTIVGQIVCTDAGRWGVQREFNRRLKKRFEELDIRIANPTQTIVIDQPGVIDGPGTEPASAAEGGSAPETEAETEEKSTNIRQSPPPAALGHEQ
jgi:small-conductance mechanosensitive channel